LIERIANDIVNGRRVLLWIGAGSSSSAGIPTDADDEHGLAYALALIHYNNDRGLIQAELGERFRLSDLAARITKARVRQLILQQGWMDIGLADGHRAIAALASEGFFIELVTVNYDPLLERALANEELDPRVIFSAARCPLMADDHACVVKIHGCPFMDTNPNNLVMLARELVNPPVWVTAFLQCRQLERVFVYIGFSGNAPYVRDSITAISGLLGDQRIDAFGVDRRPADEVFENGNGLGDFYRISHVPRENYSDLGSDAFLQSLADAVFNRLVETEIAAARHEAEQHGAPILDGSKRYRSVWATSRSGPLDGGSAFCSQKVASGIWG
jgi:hypothetical protein